jgi:CRISPR-associated protein (TIGR02584 family)
MTLQIASREAAGKRILLAVTGLSPQIVTETLYAIACSAASPWVPDSIHIITTREGAQRARLALFSEEPGWFARLCVDYNLPRIDFTPDHIHTIPDARGIPLDDIRSPEDNERAADFITETVRRLTEDPESELHVSIAGGRKTLGYYLGYALSLYGRPQDRLSHVLVSEPFESSWDFFYPTPYSRVIETRDHKLADTKDAQVTLAEIPFVRLRDGLPRELLSGGARFSEVVAEAQKVMPPLSLVLEPSTRRVTAGGETFTLKPAEFAFYWMFAERALHGRPGLHWSDTDIAEELLGYYARLVKPASGDFQRAELAYRRGMTKDNYDPAKTHVHDAIRNALGERRAQPYLLQSLGLIPGTRYHRKGLTLPPRAIRVMAPGLPTRQGQNED